MRRPAAFLISICLGLGPAWAEAVPGIAAPMMPRPYAELLSKNKFELRADGTVWSADGAKSVSQAEVPFLLHRLESGQRLKALIQLDMLLSNSDGEKYLTPVEKENLRKIVRENWPFFTLGTRKDFRHFFSIQELEQMNRDPAPTDTATALTMRDPELPDFSDIEALPEVKPVPMPRLQGSMPPLQSVYTDAAPPPARTAAPVYVVAMAPGTMPMGAYPPVAILPAAPPPPEAIVAAPPPAPATPERSDGMPVRTPDAALPQPSAPQAALPQPAQPQPAAPQPALPPAPVAQQIQSSGGGINMESVIIKKGSQDALQQLIALAQREGPRSPTAALPQAPTPVAEVPVPADSGASAAARSIPAPILADVASAAGPPSRVAPAPQPPAAPPPAVVAPMPPTQPIAEAGLPPSRVVPQDELEAFLRDAPYGHDAKALIRMISEKAVEPSRSRALGVLMGTMPQIVFDTARAGLDAHAALLAVETEAIRAYTIALSPGPILVQKKKLFGTGPTIMLSDSAKVYASLHVPVPTAEALKKESVAARQENGEWGATRVYADESRRGAYTQPSMAGFLLRKLLRLDAKRGGWDASPYAAEAYARSAQWMFYARVVLDLKDDAFLDPETRASFRQWRDQPNEYRDHLIHTLASGRVQTLDPRKGNAETQLEFARGAQTDCVAIFKADLQARLQADREALKQDARALARAGLIEDSSLEEAVKKIDTDFASVRLPEPSAAQCAGRYHAEATHLRASAALFAEMSQAERTFRGVAAQ